MQQSMLDSEYIFKYNKMQNLFHYSFVINTMQVLYRGVEEAGGCQIVSSSERYTSFLKS